MNHDLARHIGTRLRSRRRLLDLSQEALAVHCNCSFQTIHKYETGAVQISAATLYAAGCALDVPTSYFFDGFSDAPSRAGETVSDRGAATA